MQLQLLRIVQVLRLVNGSPSLLDMCNWGHSLPYTCLAGWAKRLFADTSTYECDIHTVGARELGLNPSEAWNLFYAPRWSRYSNQAYDLYRLSREVDEKGVRTAEYHELQVQGLKLVIQGWLQTAHPEAFIQYQKLI